MSHGARRRGPEDPERCGRSAGARKDLRSLRAGRERVLGGGADNMTGNCFFICVSVFGLVQRREGGECFEVLICVQLANQSGVGR